MYPEIFTLKDLPVKNGKITESFTLYLKREYSECMVVTSLARYEGEVPPTVQFFLRSELDASPEKPFYGSHIYKIGKRDEWTRQQWKIPPMIHPSLHCEICVTVPRGSALIVSDFHNCYNAADRPFVTGLRFNAHLGFSGMAPSNTLPAFELAAQCGFPTCICNPKEIGDGSLVCIHDSLIQRHARDENGLPPEEPRRIYQMTLPELRRWDYGIRKHPLYKGTKIPELEEYFAVCAKTGMKPMFSAHPGCLKSSGWLKVKELLRQYGLTRQLHVKSARIAVLEKAFEYFGDEIDGYTLNNEPPEELAASKLAGANCRLVVEWQAGYYTEEAVHHILESGFSVAAYNLPRGEMSVYEKLISWGVTEFTEDHHISIGLNW
ncbi:MAG: hypothetical protein E7580_02675 [Ruminococcaceae bacterium]|nr:hypothetical protein [Oscillospiraceae bacterium]